MTTTLRGCASGARLAGHSSARRAGGAARQHQLLPRVAGAVDEPRAGPEHLVARPGAARAAARRARAPSAPPRPARGARRRGRRWRCGDRAAGVRVGVDGRSLVGGGARGVAHYTAALLEALAAEFPDDEYRVLLPRGRAMVPRGVVPVRHPLPARVLFGAAAVSGRPRLDRCSAEADVVWAPAPAPLARGRHAARAHRPRPVVGGAAAGLHALRAALARGGAAAVGWRGAPRGCCATRRSCARDADREWGLAAGPGRARPARPPPPCPAPPRRAATPYFLFVGALEPRKAPDVLVDAFLRARARGLEAELLIVGAGRLDPRRARASGGSAASTTSARSTPARSRWCCRRGSRASGCRRSRPSRPARPPSSATCRSCARCSATARSTCGPGDAAGLADALLRVAADPGAPRAAARRRAAPRSRR